MVIENCAFTDNSANVKGGAIYTDCDETTYDCSLTIDGESSFTNNSVLESGGAIYWKDVEPVFPNFAEITFSNNFALVYADDIASFPAQIISLN